MTSVTDSVCVGAVVSGIRLKTCAAQNGAGAEDVARSYRCGAEGRRLGRGRDLEARRGRGVVAPLGGRDGVDRRVSRGRRAAVPDRPDRDPVGAGRRDAGDVGRPVAPPPLLLPEVPSIGAEDWIPEKAVTNARPVLVTFCRWILEGECVRPGLRCGRLLHEPPQFNVGRVAVVRISVQPAGGTTSRVAVGASTEKYAVELVADEDAGRHGGRDRVRLPRRRLLRSSGRRGRSRTAPAGRHPSSPTRGSCPCRAPSAHPAGVTSAPAESKIATGAIVRSETR